MLFESMRAVSRSLALATFALHLLAVTSSAHFGGEAFILVTGDHVDPGLPFEVIVADLAPGSTVELSAVRNGLPVSVGSAQSDTEGHFTTSGTLPADFPHGYFELVATAGDGTRVSTWVLAGPRTSDTATAPVPPAAGGELDPSLVVLILLLGGSIGAAGYLMLRRVSAAAHPAAARRPMSSGRSRVRRRQG
jgi:hypothetical protein